MSGFGARLCAIGLTAFFLGAVARLAYSQDTATRILPLEASTAAQLDAMYTEWEEYFFVPLRISTEFEIERDALLSWGFEPDDYFIDYTADEIESIRDRPELLQDEHAIGLSIFDIRRDASDELKQFLKLRRFKALQVDDSPEVARLLPEFISNNPLLFVQLDESANSEDLLDECDQSATLRALRFESPAESVAISQGFSSLERLWVSQSFLVKACRIENLPRLEYLNINNRCSGRLIVIRRLPCLQRIDAFAGITTRELYLEDLPALSSIPERLLLGQFLALHELPEIRTLRLEIDAGTARPGDLVGVSLRNLPALEELRIDCRPLSTSHVVTQLVGLPNLRTVAWFNCPTTGGLLEYLDSHSAAYSPSAGVSPSTLRELSLDDVTLSSEFFAACGRLPALDRLSIGNCVFDSTALAALGTEGRPPRELVIGWDEFCRHYVTIAELKLESLSLGPVSPSPTFWAEDQINVVDHPLTAAELTLAVSRESCWKGERLLLHSTRLRSLTVDVDDECFFAVLPELPQLERLSIAYHEACDGAFSAGLNGCLSLRELELREANVSAAILQTIQQMPRLRSLTLTDCPNLLQIAPALAECTELDVLRLRQSREMSGDSLTPEIVTLQSTLRERLRNVQVEVR